MKRNLMLLSCVLSVLLLQAQDKSLYQKQWFIQSGDTMPYRILLPQNFDSTKKYPLVFFLHGSGERGNDNEKQLTHGWKLFASDSARTQYPAIVVFPQCSEKSYWSNVQHVTEGTAKNNRKFYFVEDGPPSAAMQLLMGLVDNIMLRYPVKKRQVYVGGLSMGGMGTFELVRRKPRTFAAAFPICGGANPATAKQLKKTNWWLFHGMKDDVVLPEYTQEMEAALKSVKAKVKATYYPNANHNSWDPAFREPGILQWVFGQR